MANEGRDLTTGTPAKVILNFSIPILLTSWLQQFYSVVDTVVVGQFLGKNALAGVGATGSINFMVIGFCMGLCFGFVIPVAQAFGAKDFKRMRQYVTNSVWASIGFSIIITLLVCIFCQQILTLMRTPSDIFKPAYDYILIIFLGIPITIAYNLLAGLLRSLGDSKSPFIILLMASVVNIGFDILSVTVLNLGVRGPAFATLLAQLFSVVVSYIFLKRKFTILKMMPGDWKIRSSYLKTLCGMGLPMGLQYSITAIGVVVLQVGINSLGANSIAAVTVAGKVSQFFSCATDSLGTAMATYTGQNIGAQKYDRVKAGVKAASLIGYIYSAFVLLLMIFFGKYMVRLFVSATEVDLISQAVQYLIINVAFYALLTIVNVYRFTIQGAGFSNFAMFAGILEMVARAIVGVILIPYFGFIASCFASPVAWIMADAFLIPALHYVIKQVKSNNQEAKIAATLDK